MESISNKKIKVLVWADSPVTVTGFSTVVRGIFHRLAATGKYDIEMIGINDRGGYRDPKEFPFKIYPARIPTALQGDFHGRDRLANAILAKDPDLKPPWDLVFVLNDPQVLETPLPIFNSGSMQILRDAQEAYKNKLPAEWHFKTLYYIPVDSSIKGNWIENAIALADYPVAYSEYGKDEITKADLYLTKPTGVANKLDVIYHGVNFDEYHPIPDAESKKFRKEYFGGAVGDDTFLVLSVARNQLRKDLPRTMAIFKEFQKRRPDSFLYIHAQESDVWGSLKEYARQFNLEFGKDWGTPSKFNAATGYPVEILNKIYNTADCILSTSLGEGFGFYNLEGFATKTLVLAPNNTVHPELFDYQLDDTDLNTLSSKIRGILIKAHSNSTEFATYGPDDLERIRPLVNVEDAVKKLIWVYDNPDLVEQIENRAYKWIQDYSWDAIAKQWDDIFMKAYNDLEKERKLVKPRKIALPNDR